MEMSFHLPLALQWQYLPLLDEWFRKERSEDIEKLRAMPITGPSGSKDERSLS
jgi:hypothetical protein